MAKAKKQKAPGQYAGTIADEKFYYLPDGKLVKADGSLVESGQAKRYAPLLEPFNPPATESKDTLEQAFPETYEEPRTKKRTARKRNEDVEKREAAEKEAADLKRDVEDLRQQINGISTLMREDTALIKQQLSTQQKSIVLLTEIARNIKGGGSGGASLGGGFGWKGMMAAMLGAGALGAAGGYFLNNMLSDDEEDEGPDVTSPPPEAPPQQSAAVQQAQQRGDQKSEILTINATQLTFNSDKLRFEVNDLTIDADKINGSGSSSGAIGGSPGGGPEAAGPSGATGTAGGGPAAGPAAGAFNPNTETPSSPSGTPGQSIAGGKGAYQGFTGKAPTPESVQEDVDKAGKFQPAGNLLGTGSFSANAAGTSRASPEEKAARTSFIRSEAQRLGIDPDVAVRVANSEGNDWAFARNEKGEASYGAFQLNTKGGVGNNFERDTGKKANDPANERLTITYALEHVKRHGWNAWEGAKKQGINGFMGVSLEARVDSKTPIKINTEPVKPSKSVQTEAPKVLGDLINPNPTKSVAANLQSVPFTKLTDKNGRDNSQAASDTRIADMQKQSDESKKNPIKAGERYNSPEDPYATMTTTAGPSNMYAGTPSETFSMLRNNDALEPLPTAPKPEAPSAPAIVPLMPEPSMQGSNIYQSESPMTSAATNTKQNTHMFDEPDAIQSSFKTGPTHKAFEYLGFVKTPPNLSIGGQ